MTGVKEKKDIVDRYNELMMNYSDETADEATKLQDLIDSQNLWDLEGAGRGGDGSARLPAGRCRRSTSSRAARSAASRSARCCSASPTCCCSTSRPTISTPRPPAWLEKHLREFPGAVLIITHDRYFLDNVTGWILELDRGRGVPYEGNYSAYLDAKAKRFAQEEREDAARKKVLEREKEWMGQSPQARQAKSKARIKAYDELVKINEARTQSIDGADHHSARRAARPERHRHRGHLESPMAIAC